MVAFGIAGSNLSFEREFSVLFWAYLIALQNLATLLTSTSYSELRTSFRSIHRSLCAGSGLLLARRQPQLLRTTLDNRSFSTAPRKDYGEQLTESMKELYAVRRPTSVVYWADSVP
jgi:hypothetical protein